MNSEAARLETFSSWPSHVPVRRLARGGFFATGNPMETQCHWCKKKVADWNFDEKISTRHRQLDPLCPFLQNRALTGNVPIITSSSSETTARSTDSLQSNENNGLNYRNEMIRLATFKNWPNPNVTPESLAKGGFYYFNESDKVMCAWCQGIIAEWEMGDNVFEEHKRFFPACPLILFGPRIELATNDRCDIGIQQFKAPKKPMYACLSARIRSYENWPRCDIQKPEILAQAGFYYQKIDDQVRCFHCNGGLRSWQNDDEPWVEHAKWFPHCHYVQLAKGKAFIDQVLAQKQPNRATTTTVQNMQECIENAMSLDDAMITEPVRLALQMGLNEGRIRNATKRRLEFSGKPYETPEELVEAVLEGQVEEEDDDDDRTEESTSMVREVSRILDNIFNSRYPSNSERSYNSSFYEDEPISNGSNMNRTQDSPTTHESSTNRPNSTNPNVVPDNDSHKSSTTNSDSSNESSPDSMEEPTDVLRQMTLEEENRKLKDARLCKICMDDEFGVVFLPCGHLVACVQCAPGIDLCPMCRSPIKGFVRTFLS